MFPAVDHSGPHPEEGRLRPVSTCLRRSEASASRRQEGEGPSSNSSFETQPFGLLLRMRLKNALGSS